MSGRSPLAEIRLVDAYIDARRTGAGGSVPLEPALATLVERLASLPADAWEPPVAGTTARRAKGFSPRALTAAAAVLVLLAGVLVLVSLGGSPSGPPVLRAATAWRLAGYIDQASWQASPASPVAAAPTVACPAPGDCYAATTAVAGVPVEQTSDGGRQWAATATPPGLWLTSGLSCPSPSSCAVAALAGVPPGASQPVGGAPELLVTDDGGQQWSAASLPPAVGRATDLACTDLQHCVVVGLGPAGGGGSGAPAVSAATADGGTHWSVDSLPAGFGPRLVTGLQCPSTTGCVLVGADDTAGTDRPAVMFSVDGGRSWSPATLPQGLSSGSVWSVSCGQAATCTALVPAAASGALSGALSPTVAVTTMDAGRTWQTVAPFVGGAMLLTDVSCAGPSSCWASGERLSSPAGPALLGAIEATADGGRTWVPANLADLVGSGVPAIGYVPSIACASDRSCVALAGELGPGAAGQLVLRSSPAG